MRNAGESMKCFHRFMLPMELFFLIKTDARNICVVKPPRQQLTVRWHCKPWSCAIEFMLADIAGGQLCVAESTELSKVMM